MARSRARLVLGVARGLARGLALGAGIGGLLGACVGGGSPDPELDLAGGLEAGLPGDLAISVTVYSEYDDPELIARLERWRRPARFVIEADWLLRTGVGGGAKESYFPAGTRQLDRAQIQHLWDAIIQSGLLREGHPGAIASEQVASVPSIGTTAVVAISHDGRIDAVRVGLDSGDSDARSVAGFVDQLAALSWIRE